MADKIRVFSPNGVVTFETCPVCGKEDVKLEHGCLSIVNLTSGEVQNTQTYEHYWHCPECGDEISIVGYICPECLEKEE